MTDKWLRWANIAEASSLVILVFIAMPLKYWFGLPMAVRIVGSAHGACFLIFLAVLLLCLLSRHIKIWHGLALFIGAFIPFGGFINDFWLKRSLGQSNVDALV